MLDIKVYYYPRYAIFHKAAGQVEYYHSESSNKLISKTVRVQYLFYHTHCTCIQYHVRALKTKTMQSSKTTLSYQQRSATVTVYTWLVPTCVPEGRHC